MKKNKLPILTAVNGIITASVVNTYVKPGIVFWMGGRKLGIRVLCFVLITTGMMGGRSLDRHCTAIDTLTKKFNVNHFSGQTTLPPV